MSNPAGRPIDTVCKRGHIKAVVGTNISGWCMACKKIYLTTPRYKSLRRAEHLRRKFGLSMEQFDALAQTQSYKCKICKETKRLAVDHDHSNGRVRGLLCIKCNTWLGIIENSQFVAKANEYLRG